MDLDELVLRMRTEVVEFSYTKKSGEVRKARGTLRDDMCPPVTSEKSNNNDSLQTYYDVDKEGWRCFKKEALITD